MNLKSKLRIPYLLMMAGIIATQSCDEMNSDVVPPKEEIDKAVDLVSTLSVKGPVLIDLVSASKLTGNAKISIVSEPKKGTLAILNSALLQYTPNEEFISGTDEATYEVCIDGSCDKGKLEFSYASESQSCTKSAVYDYASGIPTDQQIVVDVLDNDLFCDDQVDVTTLKMVEAPAHGEAIVTDGLIFYYPETTYSGYVQLIYSVATKSDPGKSYYAVVKIFLESESVNVSAFPEDIVLTRAQYDEMISTNGGLNFTYDQILGNDDIGNLSYNNLTVSVIGQPQNAEVIHYTLEMFKFIPGENFDGEDSFVYKICYGENCSQATVMVTITNW